MSEVTEFMVWRSALADAPQLVGEILASLPKPPPEAVAADLAAMVRSEATTLAQLQALLTPKNDLLQETAEPPNGWQTDPAAAWAALRQSVLALLDSIDGASLLVSKRLPSGKPLSPYRLAGELADHDVRAMALLRRR